ncbi:MAG: ECF transporter S component [Clostridiales bacterium]|nr:ECF transporter S component [Clostridiales bacterium]
MQSAQIRRLTLTAILIAFVFLLGLTPIGMIPLGFINVTILVVPVVIGTIMLGLTSGLMIGFFFGSASLMSVLGLSMTPPSALAGTLLASSPVLTVIMCYLPRLLIPVTVHFTYQTLSKLRRKGLELPVASAVGSLTNTVLYLGLMYLFYRFASLDAGKIVNLILGTGFIAGISEAAVAALVAPVVIIALRKALSIKEEVK